MQNINLLETHARPRATGHALRRIALGGALFATATFAVYVIETRALETARGELARARSESERLDREQSSLAAPNAAMLADIAREEHEVGSLEGVAQLLSSGRLGRTRGFTEDLRAFGRAIAPGIWYTSMRLDNASDSMTLEGRAVDATRLPALLHALQAEPHFAGTKFASIELRSGDSDAAAGAHPLTFRIATPVAANEGGDAPLPPGARTGASAAGMQ
jgi:Tfp pilus assembly protein PilN